jgi:hypothetical protein
MRRAVLLRLTVSLGPLHVGMDHRVKPGGDEKKASLRAKRSNPGGLHGDLDCFVAYMAPRDDE